MSFVINIGATETGGTATTLVPTGQTAPGKRSFATPASTRLEPELVDVLTRNPVPNKSDPGVARGGLKITVAERVAEEGCCTVTAGTCIIDVDARWPLSQPESAIDRAVAILRAAVMSDEFVDSIKKGILPD